MNDSPENQDFEAPASDRIDLTEPIAWNAPEGVQVQRGKLWYVFFVIVLIGLMAVALFVLSNKTPQVINYAISPKGIYIADILHDFSEFRAFGLIHENNQHSILLLPVKRFSPGLTIYFSEAEGEKIVDMLGARLPMQEIKPDALEKFIRLIKL